MSWIRDLWISLAAVRLARARIRSASDLPVRVQLMFVLIAEIPDDVSWYDLRQSLPADWHSAYTSEGAVRIVPPPRERELPE